MTPPKKPDCTTLQIRDLPLYLHEELRRIAYETRTSINQLGIRAVQEFVVRECENKKKEGTR